MKIKIYQQKIAPLFFWSQCGSHALCCLIFLFTCLTLNLFYFSNFHFILIVIVDCINVQLNKIEILNA